MIRAAERGSKDVRDRDELIIMNIHKAEGMVREKGERAQRRVEVCQRYQRGDCRYGEGAGEVPGRGGDGQFRLCVQRGRGIQARLLYQVGKGAV